MSYMAKTELFSWRLDRAVRAALEQAAQERRASMASVLDEIVEEWLARREHGRGADEQLRLHEAASRWIGAIEGGDAFRAERSRERVRERLERRRADA